MSGNEELFNGAANLAAALNDAGRGQYDLLMWICALKMAARIAELEHARKHPERAEYLKAQVGHADTVVKNMVIVMRELKPGEVASDFVRAIELNTSKPEDRS